MRNNEQRHLLLQMPFSGGDEGDRTPYLLNAIQALSQVSYTPKYLHVPFERLNMITHDLKKIKYFFQSF